MNGTVQPFALREKLSMANVFATFGGHIYIPEITFYGRYQLSENGLYLLATGESLQDASERIVLFEGNEMLVNKRVEEVIHARISDLGLFILSIWKPSRGERSRLIAMDKHGRSVMSLSLCTGVASLDISSDGCFAACRTEGKKAAEDSQQLLLLDIKTKRIVWTREISDPIEQLFIDTENQSLEVIFRHEGPARYSFDGILEPSLASQSCQEGNSNSASDIIMQLRSRR
jgi:hypothetical protein